MALAIGRTADHLRVLSDLSGLVVSAMLDDVAHGPVDDAFSDALRRYRDEGAPEIMGSWRKGSPAAVLGTRTTDVLRRLTRDLLGGVTLSHAEPAGDQAAAEVEAAPANVRAIGDAREIPALELASDGTWRPSGSLSSGEEIDAGARRRANVPSLMSRYPAAARPEHFVLPPPRPQR